IVLACLAGVLGAAVAYWGIGFLVAMLPRLDWPITLDVHVDGRVLGFNFALAVGSGLLIGVLPALRSSCLDLTPALKLGTGEMPLRTGTAPKMRSARLLIAAQMCVSMVLQLRTGASDFWWRCCLATTGRSRWMSTSTGASSALILHWRSDRVS